MRTDLAKMNESVDLTIELVLNDVIEGLQQEEDQMVVLRSRKQEPVGGERLQEMKELVGRNHGKTLQIGRH